MHPTVTRCALLLLLACASGCWRGGNSPTPAASNDDNANATQQTQPPGTAGPAGRPVLIVTEPWEPYMGPGLPDHGLLAELATRCLTRAGIASRVQFMPWARALHTVEVGEADVLLGAYFTEERAAFLHYSAKLALSRSELFARRGFERDRWETLRDLVPYRIGVVAKAAHAEAFDAADFLRKEEVPSMEINVRKLLAGRIDLMAGPASVTRYLLRTSFPESADQIVEFQPALAEVGVYAGFSKAVDGNADRVARFNAAFGELVASGEYHRLLVRHDMLDAGVDH